MSLAEQSDAGVQRIMINFHGSPGVGKTTAACMLSKDWPKNWESRTPKSKKIVLNDVIVAGWDKDGLVCLRPYNIAVKYYIDCRKLLTEPTKAEIAAAKKAKRKPREWAKNILEAQGMVLDEAMEIVDQDAAATIFVNDTATRMASDVEAYWFHPDNAIRSRGGAVDGIRTWGVVKETHTRFLNDLENVGQITIINTFHQKALPPAADQDQRAQRSIKTLGQGGVTILPEMNGQSLNLYTGDNSLELAVGSKKVKGGREVKLYSEVTVLGERTKNRLRGLVPAELNPEALRGHLASAKLI